MKLLVLSLNCEHGVAQDLEPGTRGVLSPLTLRPFPGLGSWPPGAWAVPVQSRQELTGLHGGEEVLLLPSPLFWEGPDVGTWMGYVRHLPGSLRVGPAPSSALAHPLPGPSASWEKVVIPESRWSAVV